MDISEARRDTLTKSRSFGILSREKPEERVTVFQRFIRGCQDGIIGSLEKFFRWYGELVATHPKKAILGCIIATLLGGLGLIRFYEEADAASIVIPNNSQFRKNIDWLDNNFPREFRVHSVVYKAENVLTPSVIQFMYKQRKELSTLHVDNKTFQNFCIQVPILKLPGSAQPHEKKEVTKRDNFVGDSINNDGWDDFDEFDDLFANDTGENKFEFKSPGVNSFFDDQEASVELLESWSKIFYPEPYCSAVAATQTACYELNILELWGDTGEYNSVSDISIATLTQQDILDRINHRNMSQIFLKEKNFQELLGEVRYDDKGLIIGASTVELKFFTTVNISDVQLHGTASRGEKVDVISYQFEGEMIDMFTARAGMPANMDLFTNIQRQFFESFVGQTFKDGDKLILGYILVFIYVNLMLSKFNLVQQRLGLSVVGIMSVFMGMILAYGLCSLCGLFYSAAHTVIPFLLLGIGIDNIFVITQAYSTLEASAIPMTITKRMGQTMGHAGVAVSVTTLTDVIAFFVGSNTQLPGLESFCIYAAVSIFVIYVLQVTQFVAWFSLDEQRIADQRDGCVCCYRHDDFKPFEFSKQSLLNKVFKNIGILLTKWPMKLFIILLSTTFVVFGVWGTLSLTQEYQPQWLLPPDSEIAKWFDIKGEYYPNNGEPGFVIIPKINMSSEFVKIENLVETLRSKHENIEWVKTWTEDFKKYVDYGEQFDFYEFIKNDYNFRYKMAQFLFSPNGAAYRPYFEFGGDLVCGEPAPDLLLQTVPFSHIRFSRSSEWIPAMWEVEQIVEDTGFSNYSFPMALTYINWKTDAIVGIELLRNIGIAILCIFVTTLITLGSWRGSAYVMMCVLLTCIDVSGFMHWWGLTIDITSMNILIIGVGLCVDFCAHIVHGFIIGRGKRHEKVIFVMENIAPAVLNGGFSSILALSLLVGSQSHVFISFFKIFFMICTFGLFHGLILLPVVLSLTGPEDDEIPTTDEERAALNENKKNLATEVLDVENKSWLISTRVRINENYLRTVKSDTNIVRTAQRLDEEKEIVAKFGAEDFVKDGQTTTNGKIPASNAEAMNSINDSKEVKKHKKQISFGIKEFKDMSSRLVIDNLDDDLKRGFKGSKIVAKDAVDSLDDEPIAMQNFRLDRNQNQSTEDVSDSSNQDLVVQLKGEGALFSIPRSENDSSDEDIDGGGASQNIQNDHNFSTIQRLLSTTAKLKSLEREHNN